ncbi:MAG: hypothetical protein IH861_02770 [Chloroflexi bacterium]|nr:hypothetical protein [Chloroflexota bacterium]
MDLNTRVDHIDEEMKLLKNEIKQVLLEIQEQVLNAQNPFNVGAPAAMTVTAPPAPRQPAPEPIVQAAPAAPAAPMAPIIIDATTTISGGGGAPPAPMGGMMGSVFPAGYQPSAPAPVGAADLRDAGGPSLGPVGGPPEAPPAQPPASEGTGGSPFGSPLSEPAPIAPIEEVAEEDEGPTSAPSPYVTSPSDLVDEEPDDSPSAGPPPSEPGLPKAKDKKDEDVDFVDADGPSLQDEIDELSEAASKGTDEADEDDVSSMFSEASDDPESTSQSVTSKEKDVFAPKQEEEQSVMNLVTIAGLAQWTHRVLNKVGRENLESILEVSELTGRIPKETKDVLIALVPLFEAKESDEDEISAKEVVSLLAQLDGFLGHMSPADTRLFPFLLQDELEVFPLIQP